MYCLDALDLEVTFQVIPPVFIDANRVTQLPIGTIHIMNNSA